MPLFMGKNSGPEGSRFCIIPVPYEGTVCYRKGAAQGPSALLSASEEVETYDDELRTETIEKGFHVREMLECAGKKPEEVSALVKDEVKGALDGGMMPIVVGGEHSATIGAVEAFGKDVSVLCIDAHADLRDELRGEKFSHACTMRRVRERAGKVVQVGVRDMSMECARIAEGEAKGTVFGAKIDADEVIGLLGEKVYVSMDLDGFDPSEVSGVGTPVPGGLRWAEGLALLRKVAEKKEIVGFDVMELAPIPNQVVSEFFAAKLLYRMAGYTLL